MDNTKLRNVVLCGPEWAPGRLFWALKAAAPDAFVADQQHVQEDDTHPIRSVFIDAGALQGEAGFRRPHLVSLHLIAGHGTGKYKTRFGDIDDDNDIHAQRRHHPVGFEPLPHGFGIHRFRLHATREELSILVLDETGAQVEQSLPSRRQWTYTKAFSLKEHTTAAYFMSGPVADEFDTYKRPAAASFQHVLAEPLLDTGEQWPGEIEGKIEVPSFGLVAGRVELAVADGAFGWLGELEPTPQAPSEKDKIRRYPIALTPDGIELQCQVSFPGHPGKLSGLFLLSPDKGRLVLTLLSDKLSDTQRSQWLAAWADVLPAGGNEEALHGFRIAGDLESVPQFRYTLGVDPLPGTDDNWPGMRIASKLADLPVEIPARHLRLDIVSPQTGQGVEGVVNCTGGYFMLGTIASLHAHRERFFGSEAMYQAFADALTQPSALVLAWATQVARGAKEGVSATHLTLDSTILDPEKGAQLKVALITAPGEPYRLAHDERRLAASLRDAYGLRSLPPGIFDMSQPIVPGFIPVPDGWLQLPFPNLPPLNPTSDSDMLDAPAMSGGNALDGFLRFMHSGDMPQVLSAFNQPATHGLLVKEAPWSVTLERASRLRVAIALDAIVGAAGRTPAHGKAVVDDPDLSTRGLLWVSSDRPDALEAIPRLGAGPGAYLDVALEHREQETQVVNIAIDELNVSSILRGAVASVTRGKLSLTLDFDRKGAWKRWWTRREEATSLKGYRWCRHPRMPLASQMPMTRTATSAVRPLESRDLLPFEMQPKGTSKDLIAHLSWEPAQVFPAVQGTWEYRLAEGWPLPPELVAGSPAEWALQVRGIGLAAFGVPGAELSPPFAGSWSLRPWDSLRAALRHDLPVLDEAFAMASMPRVTESETPDLLERESQIPAATALDWNALTTFWSMQERRLQLARVAHSYVTDYKPADSAGPSDVHSLVGGLVWSASHAGFGLAVKGDKLPYGWMSLGSDLKLAGNQALEGLTETFAIQGGRQLVVANQPSEEAVEVLGNSPSSFLLDGFLTDARGAGMRVLSTTHGWWRPVRDLGNSDTGLAPIAGRFSSPAMLPVYAAAGGVDESLFRFWFKDIPLDGTGTFHPHADIDTHAWQDGHLQRSGMEWRMLPATEETGGFDTGSNQLSFFDFLLEPLRLESFAVPFADGSPAAAMPGGVRILARLHLGLGGEDVHDGGNLLRLVLEQQAGRLVLKAVEISGKGPLRFPIRIDSRSVTVQASGVSWNKGHFSLSAPSLAFEFAGRDVLLEGAAQGARGATPLFSWTSAAHSAKPGTLKIIAAQLDVGSAGAKNGKSRFKLRHEVAIAPGSTGGAATATICIQAGGELNDLKHGGTLRLLNGNARMHFEPSRAAFCVTTADNAWHKSALIEGFPERGRVRFGLIASIGPFEGGEAKLVSGRFSGSITEMENKRKKARCSLLLESIHMAGEYNRRVSRSQPASPMWSGALTLYGKVLGRSAIAWPDVSPPTPEDEAIPFPESSSNGRRKVRVDAGRWHAHDVEWVLDGHEMSFDTAGRINRADEDQGFWTATVLARHSLKRSGTQKVLQFTSVDSLALGAMASLIPRWPDGANAAEDDLEKRSSFAARYKSGHPGMAWPGRGGVGTVLQGLHGQAFREAIYAGAESAGPNVIVVGGFAGLIELEGKDAVPLLKLPVLMGLSAGYLGDGTEPLLKQGGANPIDHEVAWPDGLASAAVATTFRSAVSPATSSERDLDVAARAGARALEGDAIARERLAGALLVEQSFPVNLVLDGLGATPFFLASAAGVSRVLKGASEVTAAQREAKTPRVLSLVSHVAREKAGKAVQRRAAALLTAGDSELAGNTIGTLAGEGELMVAGDDLAVETWQSVDFTEQALEGMGAHVVMKAYSMQARPRAALARDIHGDFRCIGLPLPTQQPRRRELLEQAFADAGRGYMLPVAGGAEMAGVEEGFTGAVRDDAGSGIAALSRVLNLPAVSPQTENNASTPVDDVLWVSQQRAALYLPIRAALNSEPIPWIVPGAPRTRLPAGKELRNAIDRLLPQGAPSTTWQPFLAEQAMVAAVSERPGVLMARLLRLEIGANRGSADGGAFDAPFPRFGRPAQSSSSVARMERTPRPARLPANEGDPAFHRRPCASPLLPRVNHRAWVGPADSISGTFQRQGGPAFPWTVTFVAAPETAGTVTQSWDGTLQLVAEIDEEIVKGVQGPASWAAELVALLFGWTTGNKLRASATLEINGHSLPFRVVHVLPQDSSGTAPDGLRRGYASVVLDMREPGAASRLPGPALAAIAELLATPEATPFAELKLTLHPGTLLPDGVDLDKPLALSVDEATLPGDVSRAPVTLRFPLWPVLRDRGALALEPTSLLFIDPAYDAGLSAPPYEESQRVKAEGLPAGRGELRAVLAADRRRMNRHGTVTVMADLRFEKKLDPRHSIALEDRSGDLKTESLELDAVQLRVQPRVGEGRLLLLGSGARTATALAPKRAKLKLGHVHELPLSRLVEADGAPARLAAGDMLEIAVGFPAASVEVLHVKENAVPGWAPVKLTSVSVLTLRVTLTDEPVAEPPPGLYAALARTDRGTLDDPDVELALPLYAQSPLPWRVDLQDAAADFRAGLLRRNARFVWTLARPATETKQRDVHIVKSDRNGQTYLPATESIDADFVPAETILDAARRARIAAFWPRLSAVTQGIGDADEKAKKIRRLMLYVCGMESSFGLDRDQLGNGSAKGIFQIECRTLKDIVAQADLMDQGGVAGRNDSIARLRATQSAFADEKGLLKAAGDLPSQSRYPDDTPFKGLVRDNDEFAAMILRLQLMRDSGDVPGDHTSCFAWWVQWWHSPLNLPADAEAKFHAAAATGDADLKHLKLG
jgi:hypothetical protein